MIHYLYTINLLREKFSVNFPSDVNALFIHFPCAVIDRMWGFFSKMTALMQSKESESHGQAICSNYLESPNSIFSVKLSSSTYLDGAPEWNDMLSLERAK